MAKKEMKYEEALVRLEQIVSSLERNETDLDSLADRLKEAQRLLSFCKGRLEQTEAEINKMLEDGQG